MQRFIMLVAWVIIVCAWVSSSGRAEETARPFQVVKFDGLKKFIAEQKGKVLVMDLWSDTCTICKEEFPRLVKLHQKHAKDGLVASSLDLDRPSNDKAMKNVAKFLVDIKAEFRNFVLDEEPDFWQDKLGITATPVVFVFGRDGKLVKKFEPVDNDDKGSIYDKVEKLLPELLKK